MKHPELETLALHAGGDLGFFAAWRARGHVAKCARCREEVEAFTSLREAAPALSEMPEIQWGALARDMRANIRLGLAAGECAGGPSPAWLDTGFFTNARMAAAAACVVAMLVTGFALQRPAPGPEFARGQGVEVRSTANGIQVRAGGGAMRFLHANMKWEDVTYQPGAQGSMQTTFVDPQTNLVTVANVYAD
jgi:hypothetical protein